MLNYKRIFFRRWFLHLLFLLVAFHWCHCDAVTDKISRLLQRVHKVEESLSQENLTSWKLCHLRNCHCQQQMHVNSIDSAETAQNIANLVGFLKECTSIYTSGSTSSGIYPIWLKERFQFTYVYCDMELVSSKKGWTTIQRRMNGEVNFNRGWDDYVRGFGNFRGEYWLGLENIYRLSRQTAEPTEGGQTVITDPALGFDLEDWDGCKAFVDYYILWFSPKEFNYHLDIARPFNASDCFKWPPIYFGHFSTPDVDNNKEDNRHCARELKSGWWYNRRRCEDSNLNQPYPKYKQDMTYYNMFWEGWYCFSGTDTALRFVSMHLYHYHNEIN
ncbi:fibrinogen-like protein 1 [Clavelina lepadiformis]|uniref:fibrinogen-like protein 1 n=1 Tax=Clavelina lepadiformis TaxID=159417 RepID=UPI0040438F0D